MFTVYTLCGERGYLTQAFGWSGFDISEYNSMHFCHSAHGVIEATCKLNNSAEFWWYFDLSLNLLSYFLQ